MAKPKDPKDKVAEPKARAIAFFNWEFTAKNGQVLKSDKGFPIYQNPKYPSLKEDLLVDATNLTEDKILVIKNVTVRIALNKQTPDIKAEDLF
jgi:hypothetical protein